MESFFIKRIFQILETDEQSTKVKVQFFGDGTTGHVFKSKLFEFLPFLETIKLTEVPTTQMLFIKGVKEANIEYFHQCKNINEIEY